MKRILSRRWLILVSFILIFTFPGSAVLAQDSIAVSENQVQYVFGSILEIQARIAEITIPDEVYIILKPEGSTSRQVKLVPEPDGRLLFQYDLSQDPLKPFSRIYYWYQFETAGGAMQTSASFWFDYEDNRFTWKELSSRLFDIFWTTEDAAFGQKVMDIAVSGLERSTAILPVAPELPIRIYVYPDLNALQDTLTLSHQPWVAGHTSPELGVILISDGSDQPNLMELERQIPHELMHILQYQITGESYKNSPAWLLEGLAVAAQAYPNPDADRILKTAVQSNTLIPLKDMCQSLSIDANKAVLGYAQANKIVNYMEQRFGSQIFVKMLQTSTSGVSCDQNLLTNTSLTSDQLLSAWLSAEYPNAPQPSTGDPTQVLVILGGCAIVILLIIIGREIWMKKKVRYD